MVNYEIARRAFNNVQKREEPTDETAERERLQRDHRGE